MTTGQPSTTLFVQNNNTLVASLKDVISTEADNFIDQTITKNQLSRPKGTSLSALLSQGVISHDKTLIESALSITDPLLQRLATSKLTPIAILPLLDALIEKLELQPQRTLQLVPWIQALFTTQLDYLMSAPELWKHLDPLKRIIEARTKTYRRMMQLKGRLDIILQKTEDDAIGGLAIPGTVSMSGKGAGAQLRRIEEHLDTLMKTPIATYYESEDEEGNTELGAINNYLSKSDTEDEEDDDDEMEMDEYDDEYSDDENIDMEEGQDIDEYQKDMHGQASEEEEEEEVNDDDNN